jgi:hypothetical protein
MHRWILVLLVAMTVAAEPARGQTRKLKVHISVDMEGVAGAVTGDQLERRPGFDSHE